MRAIIRVEQDESGWWIAEAINMPGCVTQVETEPEVLLRIEEAVRGWLGVVGDDLYDLAQG